LVYWILLKLIF